MLTSLETSLKRGILSSSKIISGQCGVQFQSVRNYPRKPRWVPMAKSKMYKIIDNPSPPKLEYEETTALYDAYHLYNRSLWEYQGTLSREVELQQQQNARQVSEVVELERMFVQNDAENEKVRIIREAALEEEWKQTERQILEKKKNIEEKNLASMVKAEDEIKQHMERLAGAIDQKDLDEVIEKALSVEYDYNYAINKKGSIFCGRYNSTESTDVLPQQPIINPVAASK